MSLLSELFETDKEDKEIIKSFRPKDSLSKTFFGSKDGEFFMHDDLRKKLLEIADNFLDSLGVSFFVHDITLTGSLANYTWSNYSDVDLHIIMDFEEIGDNHEITQKIFKEFFDAKKNLWNEHHDVKVKNHDVEIYVQDSNEEHTSSGVYSILNKKWIVVPEKVSPKIDEKLILSKGEEYAKKIDDLHNKTMKGLDVVSQIDNLKDKIKKFRKSGLEKGGEFSYENLTFKLLRRNGSIEKLLNLKNTHIDKKLSITQ